MLEFNLFENMEKIKDSMQFDSGTQIAALKTDNYYLTLEVRGEVAVDFSEVPGDVYREVFHKPSEFPQALKDLIAGKTPVLYDGAEGVEETGWYEDDRLYVGMNNWFELFVWEDDSCDEYVTSDVCDAEGLSPEKILGLMLEYEQEVKKNKQEGGGVICSYCTQP